MGASVPRPSKEFANHQMPGVAVDIILFTVRHNELNAALVKREEDPYFGSYALPGRFVRYDEKIEDTAKMALKLKCGIDPSCVELHQLYTFGQNLDRDTRIRTISIVYIGIIGSDQIDFGAGTKITWHAANHLPQLAFDHKQVVQYAVENLKKRLYTDLIAFSFLPHEFTLTQAQRTYEAILGAKLDKRNFRKKMAELDILTDTNKKLQEGVHRPAALYRFHRPKQV